MAEKHIRTVVDSPVLSEGVGAQNRQIIGSESLQHLDPFLLVDSYYFDPPHGIPAHPHRGFQAITYSISGALMHDTNRGHSGELNPGDVQCATMGRGLLHAQAAREPGTEGITIWLNQKNDTRLCEPSSVDYPSSQVPKVSIPGGVVEVLIGTFQGNQGPCVTQAPCQALVITLQANSELRIDSPADFSTALYSINGSVSVDGRIVGTHQAAALDDAGNSVCLRAQGDVRFLFLQAPRIGESYVFAGPYAMSSQDEVLAARTDFEHNRNGFEGVQAWRSSLTIQ